MDKWNNKGFLVSELIIIMLTLMMVVLGLSTKLIDLGISGPVIILVTLLVLATGVVLVIKLTSTSNETEEYARTVIGSEEISVKVIDKYKTRGGYLFYPLFPILNTFASTIYILVYEYKGTKFEIEVDEETYLQIRVGNMVDLLKEEYKSYDGGLEIEFKTQGKNK